MAVRAALSRLAASHREAILLLFVLPISFFVRCLRRLTRQLTRSKRDGHRERVARVAADVLRARERAERSNDTSGAAIRTDRPAHKSQNTRITVKSVGRTVRVGDLNAVLKINLGIGRAFVRVEPGILVGDLCDMLEKEGYMLESCIEMRDATIGGLIMALGMTSHSYAAGLVHESALAYEIVTADGGLIRATPDNEHSDLFRAIPFSHGTLGILVAVDLRILPMLSHLRVTYHPTYSLEECHSLMQEIATRANNPYFLEAFVYFRDRAVVVEADFATWRDMAAPDATFNNIGAWYKPWFYRHAETFLGQLAPGATAVEYIPTKDYLMRLDRSMCTSAEHVYPTAHSWWYRYLFGYMLPPDMPLLKWSRPQKERISSIREQVYQDYCVPSSKFPELIEWLDQRFSIYPLLVYPCKILDRGGMVRLRGNRGKPISSRVETSMYIDVGISGRPKAIREGKKCFPTISVVRELEKLIRQWGGFQHTFCDVFSTQEEFEEMFDHTLWRSMRKKYDAAGVFPTVYEKVVPELSIQEFLNEEASWLDGERAPFQFAQS